MLEKPDLADERIIACIQTEYGLEIRSIAFLPLGADVNTAVYRAVGVDGTAWFVKLRGGEFRQASVEVPNFLSSQGIQQVIPSLTTLTGQPWASLAPYSVILYPFVEGKDGFERDLTDGQWIDFGAALKRFHTARIPPGITGGIPREDFSPRWRDAVRAFMQQVDVETYQEPVAADTASFLRSKKGEILDLVDRAERCALRLQENPPEFILCHGDIHAWNLLVVDGNTFYMVDWDTLVFAPKERDLMFIGGGLGGTRLAPREEETLFYQGYGQTPVDVYAMAYYRYERIVEDIAAFCEQIFAAETGGDDRRQSLVYLKSNFLPGQVLEIAYKSDRTV